MGRPVTRVVDKPTLEGLRHSLAHFAGSMDPAERMALDLLLRHASLDPREMLRSVPAERILGDAELAIFRQLSSESRCKVELPTSQLVVVMKATRLCNLRCTYCHSWRDGPDQVMSFEVMCRTIRDAVESTGPNLIEFVWHGGEVTLLSVDFFRKAVWLQQYFRRGGMEVLNSVQTNATHDNVELYRFFRDHDFSIGVSMDGPPEINDRRRLTKAGAPTSQAVLSGMDRLRALELRFALLVVVDDELAELGPRRLLVYLSQIGARSIGILNAIPENELRSKAPRGSYIAWPRYLEFQRELFKIWWKKYYDIIRIREFDSLISGLHNQPTSMCYFAGDCMGRFVTIEPNGDVAACDKYVGDPSYVFGNLRSTPLAELLSGSSVLASRIEEQRVVLESQNRCRWFRICKGGCPHDRRLKKLFAPDFSGDCCGYAPLLEDMALAIAD